MILDSPLSLTALLLLLPIIHICLLFTTGHTGFYWVARGFDALAAAEVATVRCLVPFWRRWRRQFVVELGRLREAQG